jgi:hypothetical protein
MKVSIERERESEEMKAQPERLAYTHEEFVDRADEVRLVVDKVQRLAGGSEEEKRVVIFHGARGAGKTWLLHEIEYQLAAKQPSVPCIYLSLMDYFSPCDRAVCGVIGLIYRRLDGQGNAPLPGNDKPGEWANLLVQKLEKLEGSRGVLVVLCDHVDESPADLLSLLEDRCLSLLAGCPRVILVLAGRGKEYTWKEPELRFKSEERDLQCFDLSYTREQLAKQVSQSPSSEEIWKLGGGYPWSNYILGEAPEDRADALGQCVKALLHKLPVTAQDRSRLEALCILRAFSSEMIPPLLSAYFDAPIYLSWSYGQYRQVIGALVATTLVKWSEPSGGYVVDEALRRVLENWLYAHKQKTWERLHTAARDLFSGWKTEYPQQAERWRAEMAYHEGKLAQGSLWTPQS